MQTLQDWLAHCERLHPKAIDLGLDRVRMVSQRMGLASLSGGHRGRHQRQGLDLRHAGGDRLQAGWRTGVYTSPHLVHFEERCRIAGEIVARPTRWCRTSSASKPRGRTCADLFRIHHAGDPEPDGGQRLDVAILEVGLGGRLDAVNIIDTDCAIITSIDLDHRSSWGRTARASAARRPASCAPASRPSSATRCRRTACCSTPKAMGADLWLLGRDFNFSGDKQQWAWAGRGRRYAGLAYPALRGANQLINASGVLAALRRCASALPVTAQAVRNGLAMVELPGRFQIVPGQPTLVLDVAHNPHSVAALAANLDAMGFFPTTHAVFGAMGDKDLAPMLRKMDPLVDRWYFTDLPTPRAAAAKSLQARWQALPGRARTCRPAPMPAPRKRCAPRSPRRTPLIESWSSDRSTRWAASCSMACPAWPPATWADFPPHTLHGLVQVAQKGRRATGRRRPPRASKPCGAARGTA
jgi:dihydrofolate synthase/folylpolyglutamate synthase